MDLQNLDAQITKAKCLFEEVMAENFPNLGKEADTQIQKAWRVPNKVSLKRPTTRHSKS